MRVWDCDSELMFHTRILYEILNVLYLLQMVSLKVECGQGIMIVCCVYRGTWEWKGKGKGEGLVCKVLSS